MINKQITDIFNQMADVMEIIGDDPFRINTYRKLARVIKDCPEDLGDLANEDKLQTLPGVGKTSAEKIREYLAKGKIEAHQKLLKKVPVPLPELLKIPGLGPKGVAAVWKKLKVESLEDLQKVIDDQRLESLPGFGAKKAESIAKGIEFLHSSQGHILLHHGLAIAEVVVGWLRQIPGLQTIELGGSLRRCCETIGDIDLLAQADEPLGESIIETFTRIEGCREILAAGKTKGSIRYHNPAICPDTVQVDLRIVPAESMGAAWQYFTGSQAHNVRLREIAVKKNLKLNEYGLFRNDKCIAGRTEREVYKKLGLVYVPPTLREDRGEVELAAQHKLPNLIQQSDITGDMHMHTTDSDGRESVEDLIAVARQLGYGYINITDHSYSSAIANGLDADRLLQQVQRVRQMNETLDDITLLAGSEVDILMDGSLDFDDEILEQLDFVMASIHSGMKGDRKRNTNRVLRALENPYVNCISHPTGRMINQREPMDLDMKAVIEKAGETQTALEISSTPYRLDLKDIHARMAVDAGVKLCINTDAHDGRGLYQIRFGIATAQRGWVKKSDVLNTQSWSKIQNWVTKKRKRLA